MSRLRLKAIGFLSPRAIVGMMAWVVTRRKFARLLKIIMKKEKIERSDDFKEGYLTAVNKVEEILMKRFKNPNWLKTRIYKYDIYKIKMEAIKFLEIGEKQ